MNEFNKTFLLEMIKSPIVIAFIIIGLFGLFFYKKFRGFMGEFWVRKELSKLPRKEYYVLNNIMLESSRGTHQIDHIVVSKYGIFVIEMKNFFGLIKGNEYDKKWIQQFHNKKYYFQNPIHQNYGHLQALIEILGLQKDVFIPIVCISNQANLKVKTTSNVVQLDFLISLIKSYQTVIINSDLQTIKTKLEMLNIKDYKKRRLHISNIKENVKNEDMICPKCGGKLIEKNGKYGKFVGCSNFPKCRFVKK